MNTKEKNAQAVKVTPCVSSLIASINEAASRSSNHVRVVDPAHVKPGKLLGRQGDIYITPSLLSAKDNLGKLVKTRQLAEGNTQGSRHVVGANALVYKPDNFGQVVARNRNSGYVKGYNIVVPEGETCSIHHPEHAIFELPSGVYEVDFQLDPRSMQSVRD